jgi:hypothetical protein
LEGLNKKVDNNEYFNECDLINVCLLPTLYQQFKEDSVFKQLIDSMHKFIPHIKDPTHKQFCMTVFMSFLRMYFPDHLKKYIHLEANVMKLDELMQPLFKMVAAEGEARGEARGEAKGVAKGKAEERAENEKALLGIAKDLLGRGFSIEDAAKITTLELDKVQALVA